MTLESLANEIGVSQSSVYQFVKRLAILGSKNLKLISPNATQFLTKELLDNVFFIFGQDPRLWLLIVSINSFGLTIGATTF